MSIPMMLKVFSDCCICFAILGSGPVQFRIPLLVPALVCGIAAGTASFFYEKGWTGVSRLWALLPLLCLLLAENEKQTLMLAIPALYTAVVILRGKLELEYYSYRRFLIQSLILLGAVYLIVNCWVFLARVAGDMPPELDSSVIMRYGLVHLLCGVMLQRQLRLGIGYRSEGGRRQMSMLLGAVGAVVVAFLVAEPLLRQTAAGLMKYVLTALVTPVMLLVELLAWVISMFEQKQQPDKPTTEAAANVSGEGAIAVGGENMGTQVEQLQKRSIDPALAWTALVVILLVAAAVILYRSFQKRHAAGDPGEIMGRIVTAPRRRKEPSMSNRSRVRQLYRDFLRMEKGRGMKLRISDTSEDILMRIHPATDSQSAGDLRQVYLAARYDDRKRVSRDALNAAKTAMKGIQRIK